MKNSNAPTQQRGSGCSSMPLAKRLALRCIWLNQTAASVGYAITLFTYSSFLALPTLYLEDLFVLESYRGQGAGYRLFTHCVEEAHRRGCGRMEWQVLDWNRLAIDFYERLGARQMKEWLPYRMVREDMESLLSKKRAGQASG
jgi:GNAT superfamily N-acetyltransferase